MAKQPVMKRTPAALPAPVAAPVRPKDPLNRGPQPPSKWSSKTANGYELADVVSCLQKSIRRCDEQAALFWALEMQAPTGPNNFCGYAKYMWKRLCVIASEDIGLANPMAAVVVDTLCSNYERVTENYKKPPMQAEVCLSNAILYLARSPKSRECDDAVMWMGAQRTNKVMLSVPDYALDKHTPRGKRMKGHNTLEYFYSEAGKIENIAGGNKYAPLVGDTVNTPRYPDGSEEFEWGAVEVTEEQLHMWNRKPKQPELSGTEEDEVE